MACNLPGGGHTARRVVLALACAWGATAAWSGSLNYCQGQTEPNAAAQDRLIQVAAVVKAELERSGHSVAIVSRSGLALQRLGHRYSHAGVSLKASPSIPWSVRQLYYACDEKRPRIFDQGMTGFVMGALDPAEGYVSIVLLPPDAAQALEHTALNDHQALRLLGSTYSANAYAFGQRYQNCNQWLAELMAHAWGALAPEGDARGQAQGWLRDQHYQPSSFSLGWGPLAWLAGLLPWLHTDDHPEQNIIDAQYQVSMPASIEAFVQQRLPQATRIELCYTPQHIVVRRGWEPITPGCQPGADDTVTALP
ncbi:DUF2145 domain-containing protein [Rhodoferax sp. AJA081-3]|uniref:DUF2145 domain-containing protein n=1 Tax=Rhodoferax sp. AJA081-3 TaxID=2752316 RepID=UPI001FD83F4B|nr:DUF2145 domain-containing protein [Rhodoferax sp. AJA081-3]